MSIISDALKKAGDKRRNIVKLKEEELSRITSKKTRWSILSILGTLFIVGFAITAFLYNREFISSLYSVSGPSAPKPKEVSFGRRMPQAVGPEEKPLVFPSFVLNGITEGTGESLAIINDRILRKGDFVNGAQVIDIGPDGVILFYDNKEISLRME